MAKRLSKPAQALAGLRKKVGHVCPICEKRFKAIKTAKYCSNACRQRAKYQRGKAMRDYRAKLEENSDE